MIKVSIVMPVYNAQEYLSEALDSLLGQTLKEVEIICVDDGSTDDSYDILQGYAEKDSRIIIIKQQNQYAGMARNRGISIARGEYLCFLDADDCFKPDMLEKAYECGERQQADVVVFGVGCFHDDPYDESSSDLWLNESMLPDGEGFDTCDNTEYLLNFSGTCVWNKIFRRKFIEKEDLSFQGLKRWNDVYFVHMALALSKRIGIVRKNMVLYRIDNDNSLQGSREEGLQDFFDAFYRVQDELEKRGMFAMFGLSFRNAFLVDCISLLHSLRSETILIMFYNALRKEIFSKFYIEGTDCSQYHECYQNAYREYEYVMKHSVLEYLCCEVITLRKKKEPAIYLFPFHKVPYGAEIVLYGAGAVGKLFYQQLYKTSYCVVKAWVDRKADRLHNERIISPENVDWSKCKYVVVAAGSEELADAIRHDLISLYQVETEKIIWID